MTPFVRACSVAALVACLAPAPISSAAQPGDRVSAAELVAEVDRFFDREVPAHFGAVPDIGPLPERVHGALTTGEFSWGTFVRALAAYADTRGVAQVGGRDVAPFIARVGVIESANGSKAFAQLYAALALRHFGSDLARNAVWRSLNDTDRAAWASLLDPRRFYDPRTRQVINLPENFLGVAARVATLAQQMQVFDDRPFVDALLDRAAAPFTAGALYADDAGTAGRFDRYSNEYARYVYEAADTAGRDDLLRALQPSLSTQMRLWWDLVAPDGYGYQWGRSLGVVSYLDTLEIVAFLARHPQLRPAPLAELASAYRRAWQWLQRDYVTDRHILSVFAPGRGNYAYITREREWQQTVGFFGKAIVAHATLKRALAAEQVTSLPASPDLRPVARFEYFARGDRPRGVWLVRQGLLRFALPITTGTTPGVADYLPAPHGLPGFAAPVEQFTPAATSYFTLADGATVTTTDGADAIDASADGRSLTATWRRFARVRGKTGDLVEPGFTVVIAWALDGDALVRRETIRVERDVTIAGVQWRLPSTATTGSPLGGATPLAFQLSGREATLAVTAGGTLPMAATLHRAGDEPLGRGARGAIPTHVHFEAGPIVLRRGESRTWQLRMQVSAPVAASSGR